MRRLLNTLFVTSEDVYLSLDGENVVVKREQAEAGRFHSTIWMGSYVFPMQVLLRH